jgi:hypothetical protein
VCAATTTGAATTGVSSSPPLPAPPVLPPTVSSCEAPPESLEPGTPVVLREVDSVVESEDEPGEVDPDAVVPEEAEIPFGPSGDPIATVARLWLPWRVCDLHRFNVLDEIRDGHVDALERVADVLQRSSDVFVILAVAKSPRWWITAVARLPIDDQGVARDESSKAVRAAMREGNALNCVIPGKCPLRPHGGGGSRVPKLVARDKNPPLGGRLTRFHPPVVLLGRKSPADMDRESPFDGGHLWVARLP